MSLSARTAAAERVAAASSTSESSPKELFKQVPGVTAPTAERAAKVLEAAESACTACETIRVKSLLLRCRAVPIIRLPLLVV
jgi:hypothetical protein